MYITLGLLLLILIWAMIEQHLLITTKYTITSNKIKDAKQGVSFVLLSDLHNQTFGKQGKRLIDKIHRLTPDFIIAAGDMINKKEISYPSNAFTLLETLAKSYKIYYAFGNHEQYNLSYSEIVRNSLDGQVSKTDHVVEVQENREVAYSTLVEYIERLQQVGVTFLDNQGEILSLKQDRIHISALTIDFEYYDHKKKNTFEKEYLTSLVGAADEASFQLLIAHNPLFFKQYSEWGADLTVSGHMHGGLVRLPFIGGVLSPQVRFFPKYDAGLFSDKNHNMIISKGLGSHSVMFRLFNPPELVFIRLISQDSIK